MRLKAYLGKWLKSVLDLRILVCNKNKFYPMVIQFLQDPSTEVSIFKKF